MAEIGFTISLATSIMALSLIASIYNPTTSEPATADAVVVLAGGDGERRDKALELMDAGVADTLVISAGDRSWNGWPDLAPLCQGDPQYKVVCTQARPDDTKGEAKWISSLAIDSGWNSIVLVTSTYHLDRATLRFRSCFPGDVRPSEAETGFSIGALAHEFLGGIEARTIDRQC